MDESNFFYMVKYNTTGEFNEEEVFVLHNILKGKKKHLQEMAKPTANKLI